MKYLALATDYDGTLASYGQVSDETLQALVLLQTSGETKETHKMARLVGVDLPREKRVEIALTYIFGVGRTRSQQALAATVPGAPTPLNVFTTDQPDRET